MNRWVPLLLLVAVAGRFAPVIAERDQRETYVLKVEAKGRGEITFSGWLSVNGKRMELNAQQTPFEFRCEAGETIAGMFRTNTPDRILELKVIDYGYSARKAGPKARGKAIEFAWAQPGAGPRFLKLSAPESSSRPSE